MNRKQRQQNKRNAKWLRLQAHTCEECGERGGHWVSMGMQTLEDILADRPPQGFWTCNKFYGPDGKRINP